MSEVAMCLIGLAALTIFIVIPIVLLVRLSGLCGRADEMLRLMMRLDRRLEGLAKSGPPLSPLSAGEPARLPSAEAAPQPQTCVRQTPGHEARPSAASVPALPTPPPAVPDEPSAFELALSKVWNWFVIGEEYRKPGESWEYAAATHWLLRVGIIIVLAGVAFFLRYSIEKGLMGPLGRVILSLAAGAALIALGVRMLFKKYHLLGQGLSGAGFVMLYFAFYAAAMMYRLMPQPAAFGLMACVTIAAGVLAVLYQSLGIALLGVVGGYATPLMIGSTNAAPCFFYAYVMLLGIGVLGISMVRRWPLLNGLGMLAAYGLAFLFCWRHRAADQLFNDLIFTSGVHLLYLLSVVALHLRTRLRTGVFEWAALAFNASIYWCWAFLLFKPVYGREGAGLVALAVAAVYVALVYACLRRAVMDRAVISLFAAFAAVFLAMSPVFMLTADWLTFAWCLQALAMVFVARRTGQAFLGKAALVLFVLACLRGVFVDLERMYDTTRPWLLKGFEFWKAAGLRVLLFGVLPATLAAAWRLTRAWRHAGKVLALTLLQVLLLLTFEARLVARVYADGFRGGAVTLVWTLFAFALLCVGIRLRGKWLRWCGLALFALAVTKLLVSDLDALASLYRIIAFVSTGILLVLGSFVYLKYKRLFEADGQAASTADEEKLVCAD